MRSSPGVRRFIAALGRDAIHRAGSVHRHSRLRSPASPLVTITAALCLVACDETGEPAAHSAPPAIRQLDALSTDQRRVFLKGFPGDWRADTAMARGAPAPPLPSRFPRRPPSSPAGPGAGGNAARAGHPPTPQPAGILRCPADHPAALPPPGLHPGPHPHRAGRRPAGSPTNSAPLPPPGDAIRSKPSSPSSASTASTPASTATFRPPTSSCSSARIPPSDPPSSTPATTTPPPAPPPSRSSGPPSPSAPSGNTAASPTK